MIDLHTHTTESDGTLNPRQLIMAAQQVGIRTLSITDHDTLAGYDQARDHAYLQGMDLICGIEISAYYRNRIQHVLAYFLDCAPDNHFRDWVLRLGAVRRDRNVAILQKLGLHGCQVSLEGLQTRGRAVGRVQIAESLVNLGYATSIQCAFDRYLGLSAPCYDPGNFPSFIEVLDRISDAGAVSVLAHPYRISPDLGSLEASVEEMRNWGLRGIEAYHSSHSREQISACTKLAARLGLVVSAGSDFHGDCKRNAKLGVKTEEIRDFPARILEHLRDCQRAIPQQTVNHMIDALVVTSRAPREDAVADIRLGNYRTTARLATIRENLSGAAYDADRSQQIAHIQLNVQLPFPSPCAREVCSLELFQPASPTPFARGLMLTTACQIRHGLAVWFTGLSGAGKTTIATGVAKCLNSRGIRTSLLDGDQVRENLSKDLGFSQSDREENIRRLSIAAKLLAETGAVVLVSAISPYRRLREDVRKLIPSLVEVYVNAPLSVCEQRDVKGLYQRARRAEIKHFTGISDIYEPPLSPDIECRTSTEAVLESIDKVVASILPIVLG